MTQQFHFLGMYPESQALSSFTGSIVEVLIPGLRWFPGMPGSSVHKDSSFIQSEGYHTSQEGLHHIGIKTVSAIFSKFSASDFFIPWKPWWTINHDIHNVWVLIHAQHAWTLKIRLNKEALFCGPHTVAVLSSDVHKWLFTKEKSLICECSWREWEMRKVTVVWDSFWISNVLE